jgi:peptidoglycan biosynthesis protein MviN/MurJ (putative lipid II flippase)
MLGLIACLAVVSPSFWPDQAWARALRYAGLAYWLLDFARSAWIGYQRRRPHWARESWSRFASASLTGAGAIALALLMAAAVDWRLAVAGGSRSTQRMLWVLGMIACGGVGVVILSTLVAALNDGDPARPFSWSLRRFWSTKPRKASELH